MLYLFPLLFPHLQYWSSELARTAQEHADQCINTQNIGRRTFHIAKFKTVGENVGVSLSSNISELVWYWYLEGENYSYNKRVCFPDNVFTHTCDHYLQVGSCAPEMMFLLSYINLCILSMGC